MMLVVEGVLDADEGAFDVAVGSTLWASPCEILAILADRGVVRSRNEGAHSCRACLGLNTGKVSVFFGPMPPGASSVSDADLTLFGPTGGAFAGSPLRAVPDLDGDGREDLLVAADGVDTVYVAGPTLTRLDDAAIRLVGDEEGGLFGYALGAPADLDGDGAIDLVIGAPARDGVDLDTGAAFAFAGPFAAGNWATADAHIILGEARGDGFGGAVDVAGDLDGDGDLDLVAGARGNTANGGFAGRVYLLEAP